MRKFNKSGTRGRFFKMKCPFYLNIFQNEEKDKQQIISYLCSFCRFVNPLFYPQPKNETIKRVILQAKI